jgi:LysM repeat protein
MARQPSVRTRALVIISTTAVALVLLLSSAVQATGAGPLPVESVDYRVLAGDTLWDIAREHGPEGADPRAVVHTIQEMNELEGSVIQPGQVLSIPVPAPIDR